MDHRTRQEADLRGVLTRGAGGSPNKPPSIAVSPVVRVKRKRDQAPIVVSPVVRETTPAG